MMLRTLFFQNKDPLEPAIALQEKDVNAISQSTYQQLLCSFSPAPEQLLPRYICLMSASRIWQARLRHVIVLFRLTTDLKLYPFVASHKIPAYTQNIENLRGKMSLNMKFYTSSSSLERKINQYIVEVFYNYVWRVSHYPEIREMDGADGQYPNVLQMFKIINLVNVLFELRDPSRFLMDSFVNVFLIEQLILIVYDEICLLYGNLKGALEHHIKEFDSDTNSNLSQLDIIVSQTKTLYRKIMQFHLIFSAFSKTQQAILPPKPCLNSTKLRELRQADSLHTITSLRSSSSYNSSAKLSKQIISKFIKKAAVYEEDGSAIFQNTKVGEEDTVVGHRGRKWVEDDTEMFKENLKRGRNQEVTSEDLCDK